MHHSASEFSLYVGDLPLDCTDEKLQRLFQQKFKSVKRVQIIKNEDGSSRGFGFIRFDDRTDFQAALTQEMKIGNVTLRLDTAHYKENNPRFKGRSRYSSFNSTGNNSSHHNHHHHHHNHHHNQHHQQSQHQQHSNHHQSQNKSVNPDPANRVAGQQQSPNLNNQMGIAPGTSIHQSASANISGNVNTVGTTGSGQHHSSHNPQQQRPNQDTQASQNNYNPTQQTHQQTLSGNQQHKVAEIKSNKPTHVGSDTSNQHSPQPQSQSLTQSQPQNQSQPQSQTQAPPPQPQPQPPQPQPQQPQQQHQSLSHQQLPQQTVAPSQHPLQPLSNSSTSTAISNSTVTHSSAMSGNHNLNTNQQAIRPDLRGYTAAPMMDTHVMNMTDQPSMMHPIYGHLYSYGPPPAFGYMPPPPQPNPVIPISAVPPAPPIQASPSSVINQQHDQQLTASGTTRYNSGQHHHHQQQLHATDGGVGSMPVGVQASHQGPPLYYYYPSPLYFDQAGGTAAPPSIYHTQPFHPQFFAMPNPAYMPNAHSYNQHQQQPPAASQSDATVINPQQPHQSQVNLRTRDIDTTIE